MSESPGPEPQEPLDDEEHDWRFDFELPDRPKARGEVTRAEGWVDAGEITDLGTGDNPPSSGE